MASTSIEDKVRLSEEYSEQLLPNTVTHLIELAFGVFGNTIVLVMYSRYIADKSGTRYFIPILALVDLIGCLSNVTQFHLDNTMRFVYPSIHLCKTTSFLMIMSGGFSAHLILTIALDLPSVWSAADTMVLQISCWDHISFLIWICSSCLEIWRTLPNNRKTKYRK